MRPRSSRRRTWLLGLGLSLTAACGGGGAGTPATTTTTTDPCSYEQLVHIFDYDQAAPVDLRYGSTRTEATAVIHDVSYPSPRGGVVAAYLVVPLQEGPFAGIVFLHWGLGGRAEFLDEAVDLAARGVVSILISAPGPTFSSVADQIYIRQVVDARRAVDVLASLPEVDVARLGYVGHSYGAVWGGVLAGVERRIKAYVLMAGWARPSLYMETDAPTPRLDPIHYIGHAAPAALFFQFARADEYITERAALEYFTAASEPKLMEWYDGGHELNEPARLDRAAWLATQLGLEPSSQTPATRRGLPPSG